jgi:hypothetical protein
LVLSDDEDVVPRIIGLFWLALLAYFDVMFLPDVLRAIR